VTLDVKYATVTPVTIDHMVTDKHKTRHRDTEDEQLCVY